MELRDYAFRIVAGDSLAEKLAPPPGPLEDDDPTPSYCPRAPGRPASLAILPARRVKVPPLRGMCDARQRPRILHAFANHELQAVELFAWALLAFPAAPRAFRRGLLRILGDEQRHTRLYCRRLAALGVELGRFGVSGYFWRKIQQVTEPVEFICAMSLTFENANLDHSIEYARAAREAGDHASALLFDRVHRDEIRHVAFGWRWLRRLKRDGRGMWDSYLENLHWPLGPARARGARFHPDGRVRAGLDSEFVRALELSRTT